MIFILYDAKEPKQRSEKVSELVRSERKKKKKEERDRDERKKNETGNEPLLSLLQPTARIAVELVPLTERFRSRELTQTSGDGRVLLDIDRQVEEGFVSRRGLKEKGKHAEKEISNKTDNRRTFQSSMVRYSPSHKSNTSSHSSTSLRKAFERTSVRDPSSFDATRRILLEFELC